MAWLRRSTRCRLDRHEFRVGELAFHTSTRFELGATVAAASDQEAQRWLGWSPANLIPAARRAALLDTRVGLGAPFAHSDRVQLSAVHPKAERLVGVVMVQSHPDRGPEIGGYLSPLFRGRGFGASLFRAGLILAHQHLGLITVRAGAEDTNQRSHAALLAAGMIPADGPATHVLPNGRVIKSVWFQHDANDARYCAGPPLPDPSAATRPA